MPDRAAAGTMPVMLITRHDDAGSEQAPGWRVACLSTAAQAAGAFETWRLQLEPGAASPWATLDQHQVVLALAGAGKLRLASGPYRFAAPCTLVIPPHAEHQFVNLGSQPLQLIAVRAMTSGALPAPLAATEPPVFHASA